MSILWSFLIAVFWVTIFELTKTYSENNSNVQHMPAHNQLPETDKYILLSIRHFHAAN